MTAPVPGHEPPPLLLLDVDGVLAPFQGDMLSMSRVGGEGFRRVDLDPEMGLREAFLWVSEANTERLRKLGEAFEIVWATGWADTANRVIGPMHALEDLPVVELDYTFDTPTWKLPSIEAFVPDDRACVWVDDDLAEDAERWAEERSAPTLLARCEPHVGLTDELTERCLQWVAGLSRRT